MTTDEDSSMEQNLSAEIVRWLNAKEGYEPIFAEGLLVIPIADFFKKLTFDVAGDTDCYFLLPENAPLRKRGKINYDFYAERGDGKRVILEIKWMKKSTKKMWWGNTKVEKRGNANYPRLITDFIKLAIPTTDLWKRLAVVAFDHELPKSSYEWLRQLKENDKFELLVNPSDKSSLLKIKKHEAKEPFEYLPFEFAVKAEIKKISGYGIPDLKVQVTLHSSELSKNSLRVMVFSVERK